MAALDVLYFLDNIEKGRQRRDQARSAAVACGALSPEQAWPEYFRSGDDGGDPAFPSRDADMSAFRLEEATPESFASDMDALIRANQQLSIREEDPPEFPTLAPGLPDTEWT